MPRALRPGYLPHSSNLGETAGPQSNVSVTRVPGRPSTSTRLQLPTPHVSIEVPPRDEPALLELDDGVGRRGTALRGSAATSRSERQGSAGPARSGDPSMSPSRRAPGGVEGRPGGRRSPPAAQRRSTRATDPTLASRHAKALPSRASASSITLSCLQNAHRTSGPPNDLVVPEHGVRDGHHAGSGRAARGRRSCRRHTPADVRLSWRSRSRRADGPRSPSSASPVQSRSRLARSESARPAK